ncbi:WRKY transcription factor 28 [Oryza sativa Japonica Group]|uniref:DNA-binding protein n=2 Tax=Oryza sativa subsp. japonica TaxID=39947 RepID=Q10FS7_ORYSJ|nr:probable WRKY transcription factor 2 isoform X1 [Oryza sativa Japonica Group]AAP50979.1 putative DNA-binding protein [Oryza sativa Japonica Group]ABF97980.1 DNA-binding protein, putative, expressed [Oryza sativa Japonica Group]
MASNSQTTTTGAGGGRGQGDDEEPTPTPPPAPPPETAPSTVGGGGDGVQLVMPEDGYEWKKYGQKFIKNIQKNRSYFRCRDQRCGAKKKVEWHPHDPGLNLRVVYDGAHHHGSPSSAAGEGGTSAAAAANQYDLSTQYFGGAGGPRSQ